MSIEYHFYPCKNNRIVYGFERNLDGSFDYSPVLWGKSNIHWGEFDCRPMRVNDVHSLDKEFLLDGLPEDAEYTNAFFVPREFVERTAENDGWLKRGYMPKDEAMQFMRSDYDLDYIDDYDTTFLSAEEYAATAAVLDEPYVQVSYFDWDCIEWVCERLSRVIQTVGDMDGFIVVAG